MDENKKLVRKEPCPSCGSRDNLARYEDGHAYCFGMGCGYYEPPNEEYITREYEPMANTNKTVGEILERGTYGAITDRRISQDICRKFGVTIEYDTEGNISKHHYPYYSGTELNSKVAQKTRVVGSKQFFSEGDMGTAGLFGQHLFEGDNAKAITITEGELDALAVSEMFAGKWPVVSLKNGASSAVKSIKGSLEFLEKFESVVLCFDQDDAGRKAVQEVVDLFSPSKVKVMQMPLKDASDMLKNGKVKEFVNLWWKSSPYRPDGIVTMDDIIEELQKAEEVESVPYPWEGVNKSTYGFRPAELVTITSGSGMGKSQMLRELEYHLYAETNDNIGILALEETPIRAGLGVASIMANRQLHLPDTPKEDRIEWLQKIDQSRFYFWKHWGSTNEDNLFSRIRYLAKGCDCKWIILDHISIVVSSQEQPDERKAIDSVMTKLRTIVQETGIGLFLVSHLKRPEKGKGHEEGAKVSLAELRGSAAIAQLSDIVIGLERNQQSDDPLLRNTTTVRILKNRFTGITGAATWLRFDEYTGRMHEVACPTEEVNSEF